MKPPISDDIVGKIIELYPNHTSKEIAAKLNISRTTVNFYARKHNIQHTERLQEEMRRMQFQNLNSMQAIKKRREKIKTVKRRLYIMERFRVMSGERQKTKVRISTVSVATRKVISKYINEYGYFQVEGKPYNLYYDSETRRTKTEKYISGKYKLKFLNAEE